MHRRAFAAEGAHWSYEGGDGPDHWGDIDAASKVCSAGSEQSPINIAATVKAQLAPLKTAWAKNADSIVNNGHTIQLNFEQGSALTVGGNGYALLQFHFHHPSEHHIGGKSFPMEVHFVHRNFAGNLAVVGALMTAGKPNVVFNKIVKSMPQKAGEPVKAAAGIDPNALLPPLRGLLSLRRLAHHAALQRGGRLAAAASADPGGENRHRGFRQAVSDECAADPEGQPPLRADVVILLSVTSPLKRGGRLSKRSEGGRVAGQFDIGPPSPNPSLFKGRERRAPAGFAKSYAERANAPSIMSTVFCRP